MRCTSAFRSCAHQRGSDKQNIGDLKCIAPPCNFLSLLRTRSEDLTQMLPMVFLVWGVSTVVRY